MRWQFWQSPEPEGLPESVRNALVSQFRLDPQEINQLRFLKKSGKFAGRPVQFIQIFDPRLVKTGAPGPLKYERLEGSSEFRSALLFGGHIEKTGEVYLSDQRPKKAAVPSG